ncbi:MAG: type II toxin-antitoxin system RelE/ParE family toxin [Novosphingobium sp.]|nr:type II toxin-antitoxin system RelE/ParE family toxin [Novosphingobium sp.]
MTSYRLAAEAVADLDAIFEYIAEDNPLRAVSFVDEIIGCFDVITERPLSYPARDDLAPGLRSGLHRPYLILFSINDDTVDIVRVIHGARDVAQHL